MSDAAQNVRESSYARFTVFVKFFSDLFQQPDFLKSAACSEPIKKYVPQYYRDLFGPNADLSSAKHFKWYRRLSPLFSLPSGFAIMDYGGGYGLDSIFLASLGYRVHFYELTRNHIGIARWLADRYSARFSPLAISFAQSGADPEPRGLDAVFANEVAHHVEPAEDFFAQSAAILRTNGRLFLLEPNFMNPVVQAFFFRVRGFQTTKMVRHPLTGEMRAFGHEHIRPVRVWNRYARGAGFQPRHITYIAPWIRGERGAGKACEPAVIERVPVIRALACSHLTIEYVKT